MQSVRTMLSFHNTLEFKTPKRVVKNFFVIEDHRCSVVMNIRPERGTVCNTSVERLCLQLQGVVSVRNVTDISSRQVLGSVLESSRKASFGGNSSGGNSIGGSSSGGNTSGSNSLFTSIGAEAGSDSDTV